MDLANDLSGAVPFPEEDISTITHEMEFPEVLQNVLHAADQVLARRGETFAFVNAL